MSSVVLQLAGGTGARDILAAPAAVPPDDAERDNRHCSGQTRERYTLSVSSIRHRRAARLQWFQTFVILKVDRRRWRRRWFGWCRNRGHGGRVMWTIDHGSVRQWEQYSSEFTEPIFVSFDMRDDLAHTTLAF